MFRKTNQFTITTEVIGLQLDCRSPWTRSYNLSYIGKQQRGWNSKRTKDLKTLAQNRKKDENKIWARICHQKHDENVICKAVFFYGFVYIFLMASNACTNRNCKVYLSIWACSHNPVCKLLVQVHEQRSWTDLKSAGKTTMKGIFFS